VDFLNPGWIILFAIAGLLVVFFLYCVFVAFYQVFGFIHLIKKQILPQIRNTIDSFDDFGLTSSNAEYSLVGKVVNSICKINGGPRSSDYNAKLKEIVDVYIKDNVDARDIIINSDVEIYNSKIKIFVDYRRAE
jgi:hypothetical protein